MSFSEFASKSHPSGSGGKRIKSDNYHTSGLNSGLKVLDSADEAFNKIQVAEAGPSGSGTQAAMTGHRLTAVHIPEGPSRNPWN